MAHTKAQGSVKGNRDSISKRLGVKVFGGQKVVAGNVIVRQRGNKLYPGVNTYQGNDFTIHASTSGTVGFSTRQGKKMVNVLKA